MNSTSLPPRPDHPIVVLVEDPIIHKPPYYYCRATSATLDCLCRQDETLKAMLLAMLDAHEIDGAQALEIFWGLDHE